MINSTKPMNTSLPEFRNCASCGALIRLGQIHKCHKVEKECEHEWTDVMSKGNEMFVRCMKCKKQYNPQEKPESWEKRFYEEIMCNCEGNFDKDHTVSNPDTIKSFIKDLLSSQREKIEAVVRGKKMELLGGGKGFINADKHRNTYNQAVQDILKALEELK